MENTLAPERALQALRRQLEGLQKLKNRSCEEAKLEEPEWKNFTHNIVEGAFGGCVATFKRRQESDGSGRPGAVSCSHPEQFVDELNLLPNIRTVHPPRLPLPDHVHGLVSSDR